ncbi:hypothetical protein [Ichthyobacterium seriolicida]|uniref:Uncharacterized protein n=1 Tax=Ichthyobacterium seriolicida TaxID=242600 RepID=A0A1J1DYV9_9FLAO|nr:hypothetical protein [Ichthyobacterium seriolicida]BAV95103.1 hypothetical protein JBKA6_1090 [Ichthyobacterium seriolicida]
MKSKKIYHSVIYLLLLTLFFFSCSKDDINLKVDKPKRNNISKSTLRSENIQQSGINQDIFYVKRVEAALFKNIKTKDLSSRNSFEKRLLNIFDQDIVEKNGKEIKISDLEGRELDMFLMEYVKSEVNSVELSDKKEMLLYSSIADTYRDNFGFLLDKNTDKLIINDKISMYSNNLQNKNSKNYIRSYSSLVENKITDSQLRSLSDLTEKVSKELNKINEEIYHKDRANISSSRYPTTDEVDDPLFDQYKKDYKPPSSALSKPTGNPPPDPPIYNPTNNLIPDIFYPGKLFFSCSFYYGKSSSSKKKQKKYDRVKLLEFLRATDRKGRRGRILVELACVGHTGIYTNTNTYNIRNDIYYNGGGEVRKNNYTLSIGAFDTNNVGVINEDVKVWGSKNTYKYIMSVGRRKRVWSWVSWFTFGLVDAGFREIRSYEYDRIASTAEDLRGYGYILDAWGYDYARGFWENYTYYRGFTCSTLVWYCILEGAGIDIGSWWTTTISPDGVYHSTNTRKITSFY